MAIYALFNSDVNVAKQEMSSSPAAASPGCIFADSRVVVIGVPGRSYSNASATLSARAIAGSKARHRLRCRMTREQGCAIEVLGHAADYLNDSYFYQGMDQEILYFRGSSMEAAKILISARRQVLESIPLTEPLLWRVRNRIRGRKIKPGPAGVVRLTPIR